MDYIPNEKATSIRLRKIYDRILGCVEYRSKDQDGIPYRKVKFKIGLPALLGYTLNPQEFTKLDGIVDLVFATAEDMILENSLDDQMEEKGAKNKKQKSHCQNKFLIFTPNVSKSGIGFRYSSRKRKSYAIQLS